jgi:hypothetical protein
MQSTPFDPETDLAPLPFDEHHRHLARWLKEAGLKWTPQVGSFVWDPEEHIPESSPFPDRVYFVLNLGRFVERLGSLEAMAEQLVWLPTWHQARLLAQRLEVSDEDLSDLWSVADGGPPGHELALLYELLLKRLRSLHGK